MDPKTELQKNAIAEARRKELESYQRAIDIQWLNSRMEDGRMGRCLALIQKEAEMEKDFQERTDHAAIVDARANKEIALGIEIAKERREEACQLLRRQYLREHDPSLRELVKKLQAGYVRRDQQQQILHNQYRRLQEKWTQAYCVCEAYWKLAIDAVNQDLQQNTGNETQAGPSQHGHANVCILCNCSLHRRQNEKVLRDNPTELKWQMTEIIKVIKRHKEL